MPNTSSPNIRLAPADALTAMRDFREEDLKHYGYRPDLVVNSVADLYTQDFLRDSAA